MELGFRSTTTGEITPVLEESLVVAGDLNIINAQLLVQYQVKDFEAFVSNADDPEGCPDGRTLRDAARAALSEAVRRRGMDDVLGVNRGEMGVEIHAKLQEILDRYETGIEIVVIGLLNLQPPAELLDAFADVFRAGQDKVVGIAQAEAYEQGAVLGAGTEAERIIQVAEGASAVRIIQAPEQAGRFVSILRAYEAETEESFRGFYLDSLEGILPGITAFITAVDGSADSSGNDSSYVQLLSASSPGWRSVAAGFGEARHATEGAGLGARRSPSQLDKPVEEKLLLIDQGPVSLRDKDNQVLVLDAYIRYRITDGAKFSEKLENPGEGQERIGSAVALILKEEIAQRTIPEIIGARIEETAEGERAVIGTNSRQGILDRVIEAAKKQIGPAGDDSGVEIVDVRLKRVGFPAVLLPDIFGRMRAERERIARKSRAEGEVEASRIQAEADKDAAIILADSQARGGTITAKAEARALDIFIDALAPFPELTRYQKSLEAYKISMGLGND